MALKQSQDLIPGSRFSGIVDKCLDAVIGRIASSCEPSLCASTSSSDSECRLSFDTRSIDSLKNSFYRATWRFEDIVALEPPMINMLVKSMVSRNFDHGVISRFLFYYQNAKFVTLRSDEKCKIMEEVVEMLHSLDHCAVSCKCLFGMHQVTSNLKLNDCCRYRLESMIGSQSDQVTLDNLFVPSPVGTKYMYDVNLVLRF